MSAVSKKIEKYGRSWDREKFIHPAMIEAWCFVNNWTETDGGLGPQRHFVNCMQALWPKLYAGEIEPGVPRWRDDLELLVWAWCKYRITAVIGHASAGKTHTFGHIAATAYFASSFDTIITLTSTHLPGLRKRLWSDTVSAIKEMSICEQLGYRIFEDRNFDMTIRPKGVKEDKYIIEGIATDRGQDAVERIQGNHSKNHRYVIIDEAQGTPPAVFEAASNLMADPDFRMAMLANPTRRYSEFGTWCEPTDGWTKIDPDVDIWWETKRGGVCIRLDGARSANIKHGKTIFPFLIRQDYVNQIEKSFGKGSPRWWTFYRGWFAPEGLFGVVFPSTVLAKAETRHVYQMPPTNCASLDPAFEGGDQCSLAIGEYGVVNGNRYALNLKRIENIKVEVRDDSEPLDFLIAREVVRICKRENVAPENFILDSTGAGRGVASILQQEWGKEIQRCSFGAAATDRRIRTTDTEGASDFIDRFVSELWWATRVWMEEGMIGGVDGTTKTLRDQLAARQYETINDKKIAVESKIEMRDRVGYSPDEADAFCLLVELMRRKGATAGTVHGASVKSPDENMHRAAVAASKIEDYDRAMATNSHDYGAA